MPESIEKLLKKLNKLIKKTESPGDTAEWVIGDIALNNSDNFYEMLGILHEALLRMREIYRESMEDGDKATPEVAEETEDRGSKTPAGIASDRMRYIG